MADDEAPAEEMGQPVERLVYRVPEVCVILGISKSKARRMIESGEMPAIRWGRTVRVPKWWVIEQVSK